jgi:hypothetical protein
MQQAKDVRAHKDANNHWSIQQAAPPSLLKTMLRPLTPSRSRPPLPPIATIQSSDLSPAQLKFREHMGAADARKQRKDGARVAYDPAAQRDDMLESGGAVSTALGR